MDNITGLDLYYIMQNLKQIEGARVDKIFQLEKKEFLFNFHKTGTGKLSVHIILPEGIELTQESFSAPVQPMGYCEFLRKRLKNSRVKSINQVGTERIVKIVFSAEEEYQMYIELFSKGNMVLCKDGMIIMPLETQIWKDREVKPKAGYILPKSKVDLSSLKPDELAMMLRETSMDTIVTFLALTLGMGGKYAEYFCERYSLDKSLSPSEADPAAMSHNIKDMLKEKRRIVLDVAKPVKRNRRLEKIDEIIRNQEEHIKSLEKQSLENSELGELIYSRYSDIDGLLAQIKEGRKKMGLVEMKKKLKSDIVKEFDTKEKTITIELN